MTVITMENVVLLPSRSNEEEGMREERREGERTEGGRSESPESIIWPREACTWLGAQYT